MSISSLSENNFLEILRNILDEYFNRLSSKQSKDIDQQIRLQLEQLLRSTNPSSKQVDKKYFFLLFNNLFFR